MNVKFVILLEFLIKVTMVVSLQCGGSGSNDTAAGNSLRLSGRIGSTPAGVIEICVNGTWTVVVDLSSWTIQDSTVVCRSLGYESAMDIQLKYYERSYQISLDDYTMITIGRIECTGREANIQQCITTALTYSSPTTATGIEYNQPIVSCQDPIHGDVRLTGSSDPSKGIVEVFSSYYGWSSVCTDNWGDEEASVVCHSMGYQTGHKETTRYSFLGLPLKRYNNFKCTGDEENLLDCEHAGPYPGGCRSAFPARISCSQPIKQASSGRVIELAIVIILIVVQLLILLTALIVCIRKRSHNHSPKHPFAQQDIIELTEKQDLSNGSSLAAQ